MRKPNEYYDNLSHKRKRPHNRHCAVGKRYGFSGGGAEYKNMAQPPKSLKLENRVKKVYSNNGDENVDNSRRI